MRVHRIIIGCLLTGIGLVFFLILARIYNRFSVIEVSAWQQLTYTVMVAIAALQMATGSCLILNKAWSSRISIFIAAFNLVIFPVGTLAGIYYFWYLLKTGRSKNHVAAG